MVRFFWICFGGAVGTGARYLLSGWTLRALGSSFPYGTLAVNLLGSLLLGILMEVGLNTSLMSPTLRLALTTGVMGGFTTYSTFNYETLKYFQESGWLLGGLNVFVTVAVCLLFGGLGLIGAKWWLGH